MKYHSLQQCFLSYSCLHTISDFCPVCIPFVNDLIFIFLVQIVIYFTRINFHKGKLSINFEKFKTLKNTH